MMQRAGTTFAWQEKWKAVCVTSQRSVSESEHPFSTTEPSTVSPLFSPLLVCRLSWKWKGSLQKSLCRFSSQRGIAPLQPRFHFALAGSLLTRSKEGRKAGLAFEFPFPCLALGNHCSKLISSGEYKCQKKRNL